MSAQQFPESYSIFDELSQSEAAPSLAPQKTIEFPESYSLFDELAQPSKPTADVSQSDQMTTQQPEQASMEKSSFWDRLGQAGAFQAKSLYQPEAIPQLGAGALEGLTLGAVDVAQPETGGGKAFREAGRLTGLGGPIKLFHRIFRPLGIWGRLAGAASAGGAIEAGREYFKEGKVDPVEVAKEAAIWTGLEGAVTLGQMVGYIAKASGKKTPDVMRFLWDKVKGKVKNPFKVQPTEKEILAGNIELNPEVEETFVKEAQKEIKALEKTSLKPQETTKPIKPSIPPTEAKKNEPKASKEEIQIAESKVAEKPSIPDGAVLDKPEHISTGIRAGKGVATVPIKKVGEGGKEYFVQEPIEITKEEQQLIEASNSWEKAGDLKEASSLSQQAREMIFNRMKGDKTPPSVISEKAPVKPKKVVSKESKPELTDVSKLPTAQQDEYNKLVNQYGKVKLPNQKATVLNKLSKLPYLNEAHRAMFTKEAEKLKAPVSSEKPSIDVEEDKKLFDAVKFVANDKSEEPIMQAQAKWIVDEMAQKGNDVSKLQSVMGSMPTEWKIEDGKYVPIKKTVKPKAAPSAEKPLAKKVVRPPSPKLAPRQPITGKKQAAKRSDIIKLFQKAFNDPIRLKKFKQRATGIHKLWPKVTRLLKANDVETAAHEIGHNLHTTLYGGDAKTPEQQRININKALVPYIDELKPLALYGPYGMEGFAEFTRLYVTNPDVAQELAPKFYQKFENDLDAQYPEMKNALLEAREYYDSYLHGTPQSRIRAQTDYASDVTRLDKIINWVKKKGDLDTLKTDLLDDVFPAKRLVAEALGIPLSEVESLKDPRNLYRSLRVLKGAVGKADVFTLHETFDAKTLEKTGPGLRQILKQLPNEEAYREFNDYLIARRAMEKGAQNIETGINMGDAIQVEKDLRPKYAKLAKELDGYNDALLQYAKDGGLLSNEQYASIKKNNLLYVPFQRTMEPEKGGAATTGGKLQAGKPIKRMKGSTRNIIAPIESIVKNTYSVIINAEKNLSGQVLAELSKEKDIGKYVERVPTPTTLKAKVTRDEIERSTIKHLKSTGQHDLLEETEDGFALREDLQDILPDLILKFGATSYPAGENIVTVYVNGKPAYYEVSPELFEMWTKGTAPYTADLLTKILRVPARTLRAGAILNPKFIQKNFIRDTWGGFLFTKYGKELKDPVGLFIDTLYSPLKMLGQAAGKSKLYVNWLKAGGGMSTMQSLDRQSVVKKLEEVRKLPKFTPLKWLRQVAEISEEGNRLAEFARALQVEEKTRLGKEIAAFASRDLSIDFAKMGMQTKMLNQIIPFFNATVQGGDKLFRTLGSDEDRNEFFARVLAFVVLPSLVFAWLNKDDERVKEFQEQEKDFNFITFIGDTALKIPVPFETGVIAHGLTQRMFNYFMNKDPEAFEGFFGSVLSAMAPSFTPALVNPFVETIANKNFFTGGKIIPASKENLIAKYQYKNNSSTTARLLGRAMAYMLGQETRSKFAAPAVIDHFINSWTGGLGRLMISISDFFLDKGGLGNKIPGPSQPITEKLGLDAFVARFPRANTKSIEKFYDHYNDATSRQKSLKYAEKMDIETEEAIGTGYQRFEKLYDYRSIQRAYKALQNSQREINNIWNDPSIPPETKKMMIDDLYLQQIEFTKEANQDIRAYIEEQKSK